MLSCGHVVCRVDDLQAGVRDFTDVGFTVEWGSDPRRASSAFIWFAQGPFIELLAPSPSFAILRWPMAALYGRAMGERIAHWRRPGEGWLDVALETDTTELASARAALRAAGVRVSKVVSGSRTRPDGERVRYQLLAPLSAGLPFVVSAYDPPQRPARVAHPNGAREIVAVHVAVSAADRRSYDALAGEDRWLHAEEAARSGVRGVRLGGLRDELDPTRLHGAVLTRAEGPA